MPKAIGISACLTSPRRSRRTAGSVRRQCLKYVVQTGKDLRSRTALERTVERRSQVERSSVGATRRHFLVLHTCDFPALNVSYAGVWVTA